MVKVLIIGGGTQGLALIRSLYRNGHKVELFFDSPNNYADDSKLLSKRLSTAAGEATPEYFNQICKVIAEGQIDVVIPLGDDSAAIVSEQLDQLKAITNLSAPGFSSFLAGYDKNQLMRLCKEKGYPHPATLDLSLYDNIDCEEVRSFAYPAMLKPNQTTGGRGMRKVDSYEELESCYAGLREQYGDYHLQRFIRPGGRQIKVQLIVDEQGTLLQSSVIEKARWYPVQGGSCCCAISVVNPEAVSMCHSVLKDLKWEGFADFDLIQDPDSGEFLIMEINPRVPACIKGAIAAGMDWGEIIVNASLGLPQKEYSYKTGVVTRHLGLDVLWFLKSKNRWHAKPNWFRFFGKNVHYQDMSGWGDPMPFIKGTAHNIAKLFSPKFKESKQL